MRGGWVGFGWGGGEVSTGKLVSRLVTVFIAALD